MVANCPCKSRRCSCYVAGTGGIAFSGNGSGRQPYRPRWSLPSMVADSSDQADVTITGTGTVGDPFVVTINTIGGAVQQTIYESSDTWVKPTGGTVAHVVVIGGGGGGGSATDNADAGGSGGSGGAMSTCLFPLADLPDEVDIKVGTGGKGGRPIAGQTNGGAGGRSWFGPFLLADGGRNGTSQANPSQTPHPTVGGTFPEGGEGGAGAVRSGSGGIDAEDHTALVSPTGGGMGHGNVVSSGNWNEPGSLSYKSGWAGEGGFGDQNLSHPGPQGGEDGFLYGGGGGGGRAWSLLGATEGGDGAPGVVVVTVW